MAVAALGPDQFRRLTGVSRETMERLEIYAGLLQAWQPSINLVSSRTLPDLWRRHFLDSAQLISLIPAGASRVADMGSGAGFPGLVLSLVSGLPVDLIESDGRKCAFLQEAIRRTGANASVRHGRLEAIDLPEPANIVVARALAPLADLVSMARRHAPPSATRLFLKGRRYEEELTGIPKTTIVVCERFPSIADPAGSILRITEAHGGSDDTSERI